LYVHKDYSMITYTFNTITYEIIVTDEWDCNEQRMNQIKSDFEYCESIGDWTTINNRMTNGIKWGWLVPINDSTPLEPAKEKGSFW